MNDAMMKRVLKRLDGPPTQDEIAAARNVLERLVNTGDLDASDVRRAQDGLRVLGDAYWRIEEGGE